MQSRAASNEAAPDDDELGSAEREFDATSSGSAGAGHTDDMTDVDDLEDLDDVDESALDEEDLEDEDSLEDEDVLDGDDAELASDSSDDDTEEDVDDVAVARDGAGHRKPTSPDGADAETDEDEELADEVEASLDVILADRLRGGGNETDEELDEEEEGEEDDAPNQLASVIPVRRPEEFLCQSCFLLKPPGQLADEDHQLCRDCA